MLKLIHLVNLRWYFLLDMGVKNMKETKRPEIWNKTKATASEDVTERYIIFLHNFLNFSRLQYSIFQGNAGIMIGLV